MLQNIPQSLDLILEKITKEQTRSCDTCYYSKDGKCQIKYGKVCKDNGFVIWLLKEK